MVENNTLIFGIILFVLVLALVTIVLLGATLNRYNDTVTEYMMCIKYNPDCECSDIILREYGED